MYVSKPVLVFTVFGAFVAGTLIGESVAASRAKPPVVAACPAPAPVEVHCATPTPRVDLYLNSKQLELKDTR